jgi:glycosyltransferase involved in cell wall biosynthesis
MLSVVIITKNEQKNIKNCIDSLLDWVDEIIVLDSKSEDETPQIIKNYASEKIKFFEIEWQGFAQTKNVGIEMAKGDWILSIDADEVISENLKTEILQTIKIANKDGYFIPRLLYFCGQPVRFGGCSPDFQLRLFKKANGRFENIPVHEGVIVVGEKGFLKNKMFHYSYHTIFEYWQRFNKYTELDAQKKFEKGKKFNFTKIFVLFWELFKRLFLKLGILDGVAGIFYHIFSSMSSLVKYAKLWELESNQKKQK